MVVRSRVRRGPLRGLLLVQIQAHGISDELCPVGIIGPCHGQKVNSDNQVGRNRYRYPSKAGFGAIGAMVHGCNVRGLWQGHSVMFRDLLRTDLIVISPKNRGVAPGRVWRDLTCGRRLPKGRMGTRGNDGAPRQSSRS